MSAPSDPRPSGGAAAERPPSTQEIPVVAPAGATAAPAHLPPHPDAAPPAPVTGMQPTGPVHFVPGLPGLGTPPVPPPAAQPAPPQPAAPAPATAEAPPTQAGTPSWPATLESEAAPSARSRRPWAGRGAPDRTALAGVGLAALAVVLVLLGVSLRFGAESLWSVIPLWSAFATFCAVLGLMAFAAALSPAGNRLRSGSAWKIAAAGLVGLAAFWLLVVLPAVDTDRGFVLTAGLASLGGALWIGPRTRG